MVDGHQLFTWCAWDSLFIPGLLGATVARAESTCPATDDLVRLTVTPNGVVPLAVGNPVVSFTLPDGAECAASAERSIACFCKNVHLFASYDAGCMWATGRDGVFLLSLAHGFELGRRYNAARFGFSGGAAARRHDA